MIVQHPLHPGCFLDMILKKKGEKKNFFFLMDNLQKVQMRHRVL